MPSHKIHASLAQLVNEKLGFDNDEITLGSVLPDLALNYNHGVPHFQYRTEYPYNLANPDEFIKHFGDKINTGIGMGYLLHLITDKFYNEKYFKKFFVFENGKPVRNKDGITDDERRCFKKHDFNEYDKLLVNDNKINYFNNYDVINKVEDYGDIFFDKKYLKEYIDTFNNDLKTKYDDIKFYGFNKEELDDIYSECLEYINNYLKENKIIRDNKHV